MLNTANKIKLGIFVLTGTILLIVSLYLIGSKKNLFSDTMTIFVKFNDVNGLIKGNNVRFAGIAIGTVKEVSISNDTVVIVELIIRQDATRYVRKGSIAEIGSDGLMGNKLIDISTPDPTSPFVSEGDTIKTIMSVATDDMMRTLNTTNLNVLDITNNLKRVTKRLDESKAMWDLLADTSATGNIRSTLKNIEISSIKASQLTADAEFLLEEMRKGNGMAGKILSDEPTAQNFEVMVANLKAATDTAKLALHHMHEFMEDLNITPGPLGVLARDTVMAGDMKSIFHELNTSTILLNENLKALRSNFLFRKYFKKQEKAAKKAE
jgi:phospholipid/cholesterol/gamma-HCH transport system substrate-binding protein